MVFFKKMAFSLAFMVCLITISPQEAVGQIIQDDVIISRRSSDVEEANEIIVEQKCSIVFGADNSVAVEEQAFVQVFSKDGVLLAHEALLCGSSCLLQVPKQPEYIVVVTSGAVSKQWCISGT